MFYFKYHRACISINIFPGLWRFWCWNCSISTFFAISIMVFQCNIKGLCQNIHDNLDKQKLTYCLNQSFIVNSLKCLPNIIKHEYSGEPWNRWSHFDSYISPKKNMSISLKDHRFNQLQDCALTILYHLDDIAENLSKFQKISNGISIMDRSFAEMGIFNPVFRAILLLDKITSMMMFI